MGKNGCGQFIGVATIYSSDAFSTSYGYNGFEGSKQFSIYTATSQSSVNSSLSFKDGTQDCGCVINYSSNSNGNYNSFATSRLSTEVDAYGSIIVRNELETSASTNSSSKTTDNTFLSYCSPVTYTTIFKQNGSTECSNDQGKVPYKCKSTCSTSQTGPSPENSYSNNDPCTAEAPFSPNILGFTAETETNTIRKYKYKLENNQQWEPQPGACWSFSCPGNPCNAGNASYSDQRTVEMKLTGEINLASVQNTRRQAINKRLDIYQKNDPQNQKGDKCNNPNTSPDEYDCWDFAGIDSEYLYVEEIFYSWKVRFKPYVLKAGLPPNVDEFKGTIHAYAVPAIFDEYGDAYPDPDYGLSNCNCGSEIGPVNGELSPFLSLSVSVQRDGTLVNGDTIVGSTTVDMGSDQSPTQQSFSLYCVEDRTYQ
jgi:hypothetical protein